MTRPAAILTAAIVTAGVAMAGGAGARAHAQTGVSAPLATAHVVVTVAEGGAAVSNLTAADFEVWSDGAPMPVWHLSSEPEDLSVLLLIDASVSAIESWDISTDSLTTFIPPIDNGLIANLSARDRLGLGVFGRQTRFGREFGSDKPSLAAAEREVLRMDERDRIGPSPIWDAVDAATALLATRPGQRAIILVTDGRATGNRKSLSTVVDAATQADVAVTVIGRGFFFMSPDVTANAPLVNLTLMANATGGLFLAGGPQTALFARTLNQLHHTYVIRFEPPAEGGAHRLQVRVKKAGVQAHVRSQYWTGRTP
jgi:VWFA-related protein